MKKLITRAFLSLSLALVGCESLDFNVHGRQHKTQQIQNQKTHIQKQNRIKEINTLPTKPHLNKSILAHKQKMKARITFYDRFHDKWGNRIAMDTSLRAKEGITVAARRKTFSFKTALFIPCLKWIGLGNGYVEVQDRGGAVETLKASRGKWEVIDVYIEAPNRQAANQRIAHLDSIVGRDPVDVFY